MGAPPLTISTGLRRDMGAISSIKHPFPGKTHIKFRPAWRIATPLRPFPGPARMPRMTATAIRFTRPADTVHQDLRHDWSTEEIEALLALPLLELVFQAQEVHRRHQDGTVQLA